ncbi:MAG TPA: nucleoside deaminase [Bacillota bacterium]|mgnify:CR=1 FL=1|nr:nucleoside deaminase [Bacillota bacterium]HPJ23287.1 nucleoside deaminase [Bacillota bacterium]
MKYQKNSDEYFMDLALKEAKKAESKSEVPVGCVIVKDNQVIARAHNLKESTQSSLAHAEILAIRKACKKVGSWRLEECDIFVTLEPCLMCSGAIINSRIKRLIYATTEPKFGAHQSKTNVFDIDFNHRTDVVSGILASESNQMLKDFFKNIRSEKN